MSENDNHGQQWYGAEDLYKIRRAQNRPWMWCIWSIALGLGICYLTYNRENPTSATSCIFGLGATLLVAGIITLPLYLILAASTADWTHKREREIVNRWTQIATDEDMRKGDPLKALAKSKLDSYNDAPQPGMSLFGKITIVVVIIAAAFWVAGYFK